MMRIKFYEFDGFIANVYNVNVYRHINSTMNHFGEVLAENEIFHHFFVLFESLSFTLHGESNVSLNLTLIFFEQQQ